jgi:hypothetical protein
LQGLALTFLFARDKGDFAIFIELTMPAELRLSYGTRAFVSAIS